MSKELQKIVRHTFTIEWMTKEEIVKNDQSAEAFLEDCKIHFQIEWTSLKIIDED